MTIARRHLIDPERPMFYHLITRCVRRAFLCGEGREHRKDWIYKRLRFLATVFPIEVAGFAIMDNHLHCIVRYDPRAAERLSDGDVADRVVRLRMAVGAQVPADQSALEAERAALLGDPNRMARERQRLGTLGWFMRELKYCIARQANREDGCRGHFWEFRYRSIALLDQAALVACMAYVDLNPLRAGLCRRPDEAGLTGLRDRLGRLDGMRSPGPAGANVSAQSWLLPLESCCTGDWGAGLGTGVALRDYVRLIEDTGGAMKEPAVVRMSSPALGLLERVGLDSAGWLEAMRRPGQMQGTALGLALARSGEALRRGVKRIHDRMRGLLRAAQAVAVSTAGVVPNPGGS